jgi:hypothetical protein
LHARIAAIQTVQSIKKLLLINFMPGSSTPLQFNLILRHPHQGKEEKRQHIQKFIHIHQVPHFGLSITTATIT